MLGVLIFLLLAVECSSRAHLLVLYQPLDVTAACVASARLRYDTSFGMGMSDTITLVFRTLPDVDYQCEVEIETEQNYFLLIVIKFPLPVSDSCQLGRSAVSIFRRGTCSNLCEVVDLRVSDNFYFSAVARTRIKFQLTNNNTLSKIDDNFYQVTATAARAINESDCRLKNETLCSFQDRNYCFTSGVFCDGIRNCGVSDWFDENREMCGPHGNQLSPVSVATVAAAMLLAGLALYRLLLCCLPPPSHTFFTFSATEDNRLRIDTVIKPPLREQGEFREKESWVENTDPYDAERRTHTSSAVVATVVAAVWLGVFVAALALYRLLLCCLPSPSHTFFTFSATEDNRLRIDAVLKPPLREQGEFREKESWVENSPSSSSTSSDSAGHPDVIEEELNNLSMKRAAAPSPVFKELQALEQMEVDQPPGGTFSSGLRRLTVNLRGRILSFIRTPTFFGSTQADNTMKSNN